MKPRIFISSTIADFLDLRSALKWALEREGYEVLLSEYTDFLVKPEKGTIGSCLEAVKTSDYFLLLVGGRRGSWCKENGISITQMEFRTAIEANRKFGKPIVLPFVRKAIWVIRNDRMALSKELKNKDFVKEVMNISTGEVDDPVFIFKFLSEISHEEEIRADARGHTAFPNANWVYSFNSFSDIWQALSRTVMKRGLVPLLQYKALLRDEIGRNLSGLTLPEQARCIGELIESYKELLEDTQRRILENQGFANLSIPKELSARLSLLGALSLGKKLSNQYINQFLAERDFLEFDPRTSTYRLTLFYHALRKISSGIDGFNIFISDKSMQAELITDMTPYKGLREEEAISVDYKKILWGFSLYKRIDILWKEHFEILSYFRDNNEKHLKSIVSTSMKSEDKEISYEELLEKLGL